jgi:hypothetical protein
MVYPGFEPRSISGSRTCVTYLNTYAAVKLLFMKSALKEVRSCKWCAM